eukprot:TRINITY_DN18946_c0_g1_i1.p1 TRINITY_DN18946_c0_g1~~TRINITY_DN18946_c0_g1_i1.p1  ORF type:complete len:590 (-),score=141.08 TRINITY_DN18946_c0_g1_i1:82-1851(-)
MSWKLFLRKVLSQPFPIDAIVTQEIRTMTIKLKADHEILKRKLAFREMLKDSMTSSVDQDYSPNKIPFLTYFNNSLDDSDSKSQLDQTLERGMKMLVPRDSGNFSAIHLNPSFCAPLIPAIPDTYSESTAPEQFLTYFGTRESLDASPKPVVSGHALWYDDEDAMWEIVFLVLFEGNLRVYASDTDDPSKCLLSFAISLDSFGGIGFGRKHCKPHCLSITDGVVQGTFCFRTRETALTWKQNLAHRQMSATDIQMSSGDYLSELLRSLPEGETLPESFLEFFGENSIWRYGSAIFRDLQSRIWAPVFLIFLNGKELKIYETSRDHPSDAFDCFYVEAGQTEVHQWEEADRLRYCFSLAGRSISSGVVSTYEFCLPSNTSRDPWIKHFRHSPSFSAKDSQSQLLRLLFNDSERSYTDDQEKKSFQKESGTLKQLPPPNEDEDEEDAEEQDFKLNPTDAASEENFGFREDEVSPKFVARFGRCFKHGYLLKRGRVRKNWKKRYFYLVGNELHYFTSHLSRPQELLGTIHLSTASGQVFKVEATSSKSRSHCFTIESPGRRWYLQCKTAEELHIWINAMSSAVLHLKNHPQK